MSSGPVNLYEHQKIGVERCLKYKKYALFMEVGTGKTFTALEVIRRLYDDEWMSPNILVMCPLNAIGEWKHNLKFYLGDRILNYEVLNPEKIIRAADILDKKFDIIIIDEAHKIKGRVTRNKKPMISYVMNHLSKKAKYVISMTGTPVANNEIDVFNIFNNSDIPEFQGYSYSRFVQEYFNYLMKDNQYTSQKFMLVGKPLDHKREELKKRIENRAYIVRQEDCLELPEKTIKDIYIEGMRGPVYRTLAQSVLDLGGEKSTLNVLERINKMHQAANGFVYDRDGNVSTLSTLDNKIKILNDIVDENLEQNEKVIIVYNFQEDRENIIKNLKYEYTTSIDEFKTSDKKNILLLQIQQCESVNLQFCKVMIYYSYNYSYLNYNQMNGRIYRMGQKRNVIYYRLISKNTIEEKIIKTLTYKKTIDDFIKDVLDGE